MKSLPRILPLVVVAALALPATAQGATTWVLRGAGWGHGVGMSAYGAYGFGLNGASYRQILSHYYTGTQIGKLSRSTTVRVLLKVDPGDASFTNATSACGRALRPTVVYRARRRGQAVRLLAPSGRTLARCGSRMRALGDTTIRAAGGTYRGGLLFTAAPGSSTALNVINELDLNDYVQGAMPGEIPPSWPAQTLRAFAIAQRSIALTTNVGGNGFELYPDTRTQVYKGFGVETARTNDAVRATRNLVVSYQGRTAQATYFSSSGGRTESGFLGSPEVPYLRSVRDPYDRYAPLHRWTRRFTQREMNAKLGPFLRGSLRRIVVTRRGDSPRIDEAALIGTRGTTRVDGNTLRSALGLYSRWVTFKRETS